jgi:hypothetical protein
MPWSPWISGPQEEALPPPRRLARGGLSIGQVPARMATGPLPGQIPVATVTNSGHD